MQNPLQITFHDLDHSETIVTLIDEKFAKLQVLSPAITKCHVVLERLSKHHQKANLACARLDLKASHFDDIVITEKCEDSAESLLTAVNKVFKNAQSRVRELIKHRKHDKRMPREALVAEDVASAEEE